MRSIFYSFILLVIFFLVSCETVHYNNPEIRRMAAKIEIIEGNVPAEQYRMLGEVKGLDCSPTWYTKATSEGAMQKLKAEAAVLGANAIINVACENTGMSLKYNCNNSVTCFGDAVIKNK
jgi:uncharacterized protein YbjQ (UPF0145 family)